MRRAVALLPLLCSLVLGCGSSSPTNTHVPTPQEPWPELKALNEMVLTYAPMILQGSGDGGARKSKTKIEEVAKAFLDNPVPDWYQQHAGEKVEVVKKNTQNFLSALEGTDNAKLKDDTRTLAMSIVHIPMLD
ncbi:hypothetical protein Pan216_09620 [Planctomycetes bacterium Pan216]|uniref:Uncharacterized protein n=1 Tax=Kolteria novifilia TaxID=2527975 RepID=A0A518AZI4_9BACT|nr:hypothetical protein Pan216_09620 [Planctomycetes bacterium Pan216]